MSASKSKCRLHECDKCRGLDKMPPSCAKKSNNEAQLRSRKRKSESEVELCNLNKKYEGIMRQLAETGGFSAHLLALLASMTHFCGHQFDVSSIEIPPDFFGISDEDVNLNVWSTDDYEDTSSVELPAADRAHYVRYKGKIAPCQQCDDGRPGGEWCHACKRVVNNVSSSNCRARKMQASRARPALLDRLAQSECTLDDQRKLSKCLLNVIRDLAWCPACMERSFNQGWHSSQQQPARTPWATCSGSPVNTNCKHSDILANPSLPSIVVHGKRYAIQAWPAQTSDPSASMWASSCLQAAQNFYSNFDSIQFWLASLHPSCQYEYASKSRINKIHARSVVVMQAILKANHYEPFAILKQRGLENELIKSSFHQVMILHRVFLTSKHFGNYDETRLMLTSGTCGRVTAAEAYLNDMGLTKEVLQAFAGKVWKHWTDLRRAAMEMAEWDVSENDVAFVSFFLMLEEAKKILYSRHEYALMNVVKSYRDALVQKWNEANCMRTHTPCGILAEVVKLVSDVRTIYTDLRTNLSYVPREEVWDEAYMSTLLEQTQ